ncbi:AAA family ATPase [Hymenobacter sp. BT594]|uniref:AAA family ATPase n=1 Tax=Hymenobacter guriensis TaxID=2793065 RepID=A0ABS0L7Z4_9BACT|nr:AAA family ATPase [Hymenobacter guriensis]
MYFNEKYARLVNELDRMQQAFAAEKVQALITAVLQVDRTNTALMQFWQPYVAVQAPTATALLDAMQMMLTDRTAELLQDVEVKKHDPSRKVALTNANAYDQALVSVNQFVADYNSAVALVNAAIIETKTEDGPTEAQLLTKQQALNLQVLRKSEEMTSICEDLLTHSNLLNANNAQLKAKQEKLDEYALGTLAKYGERINHYLNKFAGYIQITVPKHKYIGGGLDPFVKYKLRVHDTDIALKESADGSPSLKHSLSEGDKSALALSFFLAKLDLDEHVGEKVVVFDDPMSSFDASRKRDTIAVLAELSRNAKQLIVLTHNLFFAKDLLHQLGQNSSNVPCISLEIKHSGAGSMWREHEIDEEVIHRFLGDYRRLADYVENQPTLDEHQKVSMVRCIRPVLEGYFRYKFVRRLGKTEWLGNALEKIRNAADSTSPFWRLREHLGTLDDLNNYSKEFHHADLNPADAIDEAQLLRFARRTLDVVQHI